MPIGGVLLVSDRARRSGNGKLQNYIGHRTWTMDAKLPNLLGGMGSDSLAQPLSVA